MTVNIPIPDHLLTIEEWDGIEESDASRCYELVEGVVVVSPRPIPRHQLAARRLATLLAEQLPRGLVVLPEVELSVDLRHPPTVRVPDIVVTGPIDLDRPRLEEDSAKLVIEIISPGSRRTDRVMKFNEYLEAGIPSYWIIDPAAGGADRFVAFDLQDGGYVEVARGSGVVEVSRPVPMTIDVRALFTVD